MTIIDVINLLGGLALFLFGLNRMTDNLQAAAGNEMRNILKKLTNAPSRACWWASGYRSNPKQFCHFGDDHRR